MTPADRSPVRGRAAHESRRRRYTRALRAGLVISAVVHIAVLGLAGDWIRPDRAAPPRTAPPGEVLPETGLRAVDLVLPEPETLAEERRAPVSPRPPTLPAEPAPEAVAGGPDAPVVADDRTAADRLAPRITDPRLWRPMVLLPREPTIEDVESRIGAAVELLSDSALAEAERAIRARDWTVEDAEGGRWGISPGKLHLGSVTLPLPIWFPVDPDAAADAQRWYELDQALDRTRILDSFEDRVRAIRERRDRERAAEQEREAGGR